MSTFRQGLQEEVDTKGLRSWIWGISFRGEQVSGYQLLDTLESGSEWPFKVTHPKGCLGNLHSLAFPLPLFFIYLIFFYVARGASGASS